MKLGISFYVILAKICGLFTKAGTWLMGIIMSVLTYFVDIKASVHILLFAALFHVTLGIIKSYKVQNEHFKIKKFLSAVVMCGVFIAFLMLIYANDKENGQNFISISAIVTWLVTGAYTWDGLIIASKIWPNSPIFKPVIEGYRKFFKQKTGVELMEGE
jgi:hypothetical protein